MVKKIVFLCIHEKKNKQKKQATAQSPAANPLNM